MTRRRHPMRTKKVQPRLQGGGSRSPLPTLVEERIWREVDHQARRFGSSRSWAVATMLADYLEIDLDPMYRFDSKVKIR